MQFRKQLALTPALSPRERASFLYVFQRFTNCESFQPGQMVLPLLGERAGVRANFIFNCIVTDEGRIVRSIIAHFRTALASDFVIEIGCRRAGVPSLGAGFRHFF